MQKITIQPRSAGKTSSVRFIGSAAARLIWKAGYTWANVEWNAPVMHNHRTPLERDTNELEIYPKLLRSAGAPRNARGIQWRKISQARNYQRLRGNEPPNTDGWRSVHRNLPPHSKPPLPCGGLSIKRSRLKRSGLEPVKACYRFGEKAQRAIAINRGHQVDVQFVKAYVAVSHGPRSVATLSQPISRIQGQESGVTLVFGQIVSKRCHSLRRPFDVLREPFPIKHHHARDGSRGILFSCNFDEGAHSRGRIVRCQPTGIEEIAQLFCHGRTLHLVSEQMYFYVDNLCFCLLVTGQSSAQKDAP